MDPPVIDECQESISSKTNRGLHWPTVFVLRKRGSQESIKTTTFTAMTAPTTPSRPTKDERQSAQTCGGSRSASPALPSYSSPLPTAVQRSPTSTFGGGCTNKRAGTMSNVWELPSTGRISCPANEIQRVRDDLGEQGLLLAGKLGLAAGFIHLKDCDCDGLSGWRLNLDYFVTSAHFLKSRNRIKEGTLRQSLAQLSQTVPASAWISHEDKVDEGDIYMEPAYLLAWQPEYDIAVFRYAKPEQSHTKPTVDLCQLVNIDTLLSCTPGANPLSPFKDTVWSTGYNGADKREWDQYWNENFDKETEEGRRIIQSQHGKADATEDDRPPPPDFEKFMHPGRRTMTFGTQGELNRVNGARYGQHSLTGWFGRSGSMICAMRKPNQAVIIGIFAGGEMEYSPITGNSPEHNCFNHLTYFDENHIRWIKQVLALGDQRCYEIQFPSCTTN